jgi:hypothetical protein
MIPYTNEDYKKYVYAKGRHRLWRIEDPVASPRGTDLGDVGLPGYCAAVTIDADGSEHLALLAYNAGPANYWPEDWGLVAPHEVIGLTVYQKRY